MILVPRTTIVALGAFFWLASAVGAESLRAQEEVGFVAAVNGAWTLRTPGARQVVSRGMLLPSRGVLSPPDSFSRAHYISIVLRNGARIDRNCDRAEDCTRPIVLPQRLKRGFVSSIVAAAGRLINKDPPRYVALVSRGGGWHDIVLLRTAGGVDVGPLLKGSSRGRYRLQLQRINADNGQAATVEPADVDWVPGAPAWISPNGLTPGLYVAMSTEDPSLEAWVLIRGHSRYATDAEDFNRAVEITAHWGSAGDDEVRREFLRAYLHSLALENPEG